MQGEKLPILLTGATGAIGTAAARELLRRGESVILACRDERRGATLVESLRREFPQARVELTRLDLASEKDVREGAARLAGRPLKALVNNAGIMNRSFRLDADGRESTLGVNYFNTRLLTELLLPQIADGGAIVFTTSLTRYMWRTRRQLPERVEERDFSQLGTYGLSKTLLTRWAARLAVDVAARGIRVNCADPGIVNSSMISMKRWFDPLADIFFRPFIRSPRRGAEPALRALYAPAGASAAIYCRRRRHRLC